MGIMEKFFGNWFSASNRAQVHTFSVTLNGKTYEGHNIVINDDTVIVDGVAQDRVKPTEITINGNVDKLEVQEGNIVVNGDVGTLDATVGNVSCGDVAGNVSVGTGNVECNRVGSKPANVKQNRYSGDLIVYGAIAALFDDIPEATVTCQSGAQQAFDAAHKYIHSLRDSYEATVKEMARRGREEP